jgi:transcriptional antiterminator Rof (Rho-off)
MAKIQGDIPSSSETPRAGSRFEKVLENARIFAADKPNSPPPREAKADESAPSLFDYKSIEAPGKHGKGTIRYITRDDKEVVVSRANAPKLYEQVLKDQLTLQAQSDGYTLSIDNGDTLSYAEHLIEIDTSHADEGVITYKFGANQWVVNSTLTPDTFKLLTHAKDALAFKKDGYELLGSTQTLPASSTEYKSIEHKDNGVTLVETKDGKRYVVSEDLNPEISKQLGYQSDVQKLLDKGKADGYELVSSLPSDYDVTKLSVESIDEKTGVIQFQYDGKKYLLPPGDASEAESSLPPGVRVGLAGANDKSPSLELRGTRLYELLTALKQTEGTVAHDALVNAIKNKDYLAHDTETPTSVADIDNIHAYSEGGVQVITLKNGKTITVIEALAPKSFQAYGETGKTLDGINRAQGDGYRLATRDDYLPSTEDISGMGAVGDYGPGLIAFTYQKPGGQQEKIVVSEEVNPELFAQVAGHRNDITTQINDVDELRKQYGLPPSSELNVNDLPTTEKDEDGNPLSIQDLTLQNLVKEYRAGVENGSIGADDPRAKFLRALEAKSMADNGMTVIPEHGRGYKADASDPVDVTSRDVREEIFDVKAIDQTLAELSGDKTITADLERFDKDSKSKVVGGEGKITEVEEKLKTSANSEGFRNYIKALQDSGKTELAQQEIQQTYLGLAQIDPKMAEQFKGDLSRDTMIMDLDAILGDPSKITEDNSALAAIDTTKYWLRAARGMTDIPAQLINTWETTVEKFMKNKDDAVSFSKVYAELGDKYMRNGTITEVDIKDALAAEKNAFKSLSSTEKDSLTKMFTTMKDTGTLGSMSGLFGLARGIYQLHGDPGKLASTPEGRLGIAADFITFASFSNGFLTLGSKTADLILKTKIYDNLGLSKTIPDMWRQPSTVPPVEIESDLAKHLSGQGFLPDKPDTYIPDGKGGFRVEQGGANSGGSWITDEKGGGAVRNTPTGNPANYPNYDAEAFKAGYLDGNNNTKYRIAGAGNAHRIAGSVSRFIGSSADLAGAVTGIVLGAFGIRDGLKNHDSLQTASGFLGVFGGASGVVAGVASVNGAWGLIGGTAGRVIGALGPVGFVASAVLGFVGAILGTIKSKKLHKISGQKWDQLKQFEKDGLLQPNGADNYVWLQTYLSNYRQRDAPAGQSIFDFREKEFKGEDKTHNDYMGDGLNELTKGYAWASGFEYTFIDDEGKEHTYVSGYGYFDPKEDGLPEFSGN